MSELQSLYGRTIRSIDARDEELIIAFEDDTSLTLCLERSCCESLYFCLDDDVSYYCGAELRDLKLARWSDVEAGYDSHEIAFLDIYTSNGVLSVCAHNEHNGYYGGFSIYAYHASKRLGQVTWDAPKDEETT